MVVSKEEVRRRYLKKRLDLKKSVREKADERIRENLTALPEFKKAKRILLYCAAKGEPDLSPVFNTILEDGKALVLPKVNRDGLELLEVEDPRCLTNGTFNIPEPSRGKKINPEELDLAVVPGIIFDREGYRIGFGKGYYDRLLKRVSAPKVGVAYSFQVLGRIPRDEWDVPVDIVVTEKEVIRRL